MAFSKIAAENLGGSTLPVLAGGSLTGISAGKVNQLITMNTSSQTTTTSQTYADTNITASITPSATNSKILIFITDSCKIAMNDSNDDQGMSFRITRTVGGSSSSVISDQNAYEGFYSSMQNTNMNNQRQHMTFHYVDTSHNTTSAVTYTHQINAYRGNSGALAASVMDNNRGNMTLMEILAWF